MFVGYARVSTQDQDTALQLDALFKAGCEKVFEEKASGASSRLLKYSPASEPVQRL